MIELNIFPECNVDTKIAEILGGAKKKYNHHAGVGGVSNKMQTNKLKDQPVLGIIDEDKGKGSIPKYFLEFYTILEKDNLILKGHPNKKHFLILVCPAAEKWLMNDAKRVGISPTSDEYNLPDKLKDFTDISKIKDIDRNEGFYRFIKALVREKSPSITTLKLWIELFKENNLDSLKTK
ncbi:MAG: hypothetical protein ABIX01_06490 [Chitinophagaceae bacterium]